MTDKKKTDRSPEVGPEDIESRRKTVRRILAGGGVIAGSHLLAGEWTKPIVESVILPAHAQTSLEDPCIITILSGDQSSTDVTVRIDGFVEPPQGDVNVTVNVETVGGSGDSAGPFNVQTANDGTYFVNNVTLGGGPGITAIRADVSIPGDSDSCQTAVPATSSTTLAPTSTPASTTTPASNTTLAPS